MHWQFPKISAYNFMQNIKNKNNGKDLKKGTISHNSIAFVFEMTFSKHNDI